MLTVFPSFSQLAGMPPQYTITGAAGFTVLGDAVAAPAVVSQVDLNMQNGANQSEVFLSADPTPGAQFQVRTNLGGQVTASVGDGSSTILNVFDPTVANQIALEVSKVAAPGLNFARMNAKNWDQASGGQAVNFAGIVVGPGAAPLTVRKFLRVRLNGVDGWIPWCSV